jgi:hypothetical protein
MSFVCSIVLPMSSSKREILTDCESACDSDSFVLDVSYDGRCKLTYMTSPCGG